VPRSLASCGQGEGMREHRRGGSCVTFFCWENGIPGLWREHTPKEHAKRITKKETFFKSLGVYDCIIGCLPRFFEYAHR
jgi:hypothetical protein